jgi:pimeloyl-ACP methyl ester carboxylesterase
VTRRLLSCVLLLAGAAAADSRNQVFSDFTTPMPLERGDVLVLGIVGGWERWDAPQRAIRRTALELRAMRLDRVWVETVENHKIELAEELVEKAFPWGPEGAELIVYGQSLGGRATLRFCRWLNEKRYRVRLALLVDSYGKDPYTVPPNVAAAANLYQRDTGPVKGAPLITAEDLGRTRILGNWRYSYEGREVEMPGEPGIRKWFMGSHLKMEYDPEPWTRVKEMIVGTIRGGGKTWK